MKIMSLSFAVYHMRESLLYQTLKSGFRTIDSLSVYLN